VPVVPAAAAAVAVVSGAVPVMPVAAAGVPVGAAAALCLGGLVVVALAGPARGGTPAQCVRDS
jgi:hypothetical protein